MERGKIYAVYLRGGSRAELRLELPCGRYRAEWLNTKTGRIDKTEDVDHGGGAHTLVSPDYEEDIALRIRRCLALQRFSTAQLHSSATL